MKKNFWSFLAVLLTGLFVSATAVQAADISFGGQLLERATYSNTAEDSNAADWNVAQRLRLNTTVKASGVTMFSQLDSIQTWGTDVWPGTDSHGNDGSGAVGVHQAHLTIPNLYDSGWTAKLGRQEIVLDGHRLFGHTGWNLNAVTHDAAVLVNPSYDLIYALSYMANAGQANTNEDAIAHVFRKGLSLAGGKTALYFVTVDDGSNAQDNVMWHTIGIRQAGKAAGYDYRVEYYHQGGKVIPSVATSNWVANHGADLDAYMFGARIGKKVNNTKVTLWYDYLSGNDNSDATNNDWSAFHTVADTGHKFYGLIDNFGNQAGAGTDYMGLQDAAIKLVHPVAPGWTLKADYHLFWMAEDPGDNLTAWQGNANDDATADEYLGDELDLTLKHKYNANTAVQFGYSWFNGSETFHNTTQSGANEEQHWAYAQVNFTY